MLPVLFWILALCAVYSYFLYPLALLLLRNLIRPDTIKAPATHASEPPFLSLIVTVYNEKHRIEQKIQNVLALDYPPDRLELIVASDCSDDGTDELVQGYADRGIRLVRAQDRLGKENAQLAAIQAAKGEVLVFSDVATQMDPEALQNLSLYFADSRVGAVSSEDRFISKSGKVAGEGAYVKYEMWLRRQESQLGGLVGLSGSFFAARAEVCEQWDIHSPSDFNTALNCARLGLRSVTAPDVLGYYEDLKDASREYARKVRTVLRGMTGLARHPDVLNPVRFGLFSFQVFSHKLMRWGVPWFLGALLVVTLVLANDGWIYSLALVAQAVFYGVAAWGHWGRRGQDHSAVRLVYFFVQVNLALADSAIQFVKGKRMTTWKPSAR
ncbi:glycosyltransferase family 2 protein [Saccharospirillum impatiens]|uniref:glycosyltransferase family 2 protein n=1 Tax=Saccharospirillum impatiens TaxID=169438 RepID=UPI00040131DE|nr:glycosyltransferase family 2 protein [Saccharospirillum impatiens]